MEQQNYSEFSQYCERLFQQNQGKRILHFVYQGIHYWLKQPEKLKGIWHFLKPNPKAHFLQEVDLLKKFNRLHAPVPKLMLATKNYLVLEDAGFTVQHWVGSSELETPDEVKMIILHDATSALCKFHQLDLIHGRPAIRDIAWDNHQVRFIDFEVQPQTNNLTWKKMRDVSIFIYSLCRSEDLTNNQILAIIQQLAHEADTAVWKKLLYVTNNMRWLYWILRPFKSIAKTDLIGIYRYFEVFSTYHMQEEK